MTSKNIEVFIMYGRRECPFCGYSFAKEYPNQRFCCEKHEDAYKRNKRRGHRLDCKQTKVNSELFAILKKLDRYNKLHGTNLNYGVFVAMIER